jgi:hypothetical protein
LDCDGNNEQTDCRTYFSNGTLTPSNRYSINSWAHKHIETDCSANIADNGDTTTDNDAGTCVVRYKYNNAQMFEKFGSLEKNG